MNRKTIILGGVLIALIILAYLYQGPLKKWQRNLGQPKNFLADIDMNIIDKVEVITGGNSVVLTKQSGILADTTGSKWKYNDSKDFYADPDQMSNVLASLKAARAAELDLVSNNSARKSEFKTDSTGLAVRIYQADKKAADFVVGSRAGDYGSTYISSPQSPATYSVKADLRNAFEPAEWRDLTIFSLAAEKIKKIRFQYPNREFTVEFKNDKWQGILPDKFTVDQEKIDKVLRVMSNLKAVEIPEQTFKNTGLDKHLIIIEASGEAVDNILMVGESRGGLSYAKRGESDNIYLINKSDRDELDKWIWQLR